MERISRILELREFFSFQTDFNLVNATVVCAIQESIKDQSKWTEAWDNDKLQVPGLSYNWWGFQNLRYSPE